MGNLLLLLGVECDRARRLALLEGSLVAQQHLVGLFRHLVAARLRLLLHALDAALDGLEVFQLQFRVDDFLVAHGIHRAVHVGHVVVVEAPQHVDDGIRLADVGKEFIAQSLAFACALDQSGDVHNLDRRRHNPARMHQLRQFVETVVRDGYHAHVGFYRTKGEVCRLRLRIRQAVE